MKDHPPLANQVAISVRFVEISEKNAGQRVDNFLLTQCKGVPKSKIYRIIRKGEVRINKKRCKPETKLAFGDQVRIPPIVAREQKVGEGVSESLKSLLAGAVLYEDDGVLAINKPSGLAVHGGSGVNVGMIEALRQSYPDTQFLELVHRLDRDTSGVVLVAKSRASLRHLHKQFREDRVNKTYHLLSYGKWPKHRREVDAPLRKNDLKSGERMVCVAKDGKPSRTLFKTINSNKLYSFLEAKPITGRTHQIRVHAAFMGCPIIGDKKYVRDDHITAPLEGKGRLMLHARNIEFESYAGEQLSISSPYETLYNEILQRASLMPGTD